METLSFAFGMLAMVAVIMIAGIVVSIVKVYKNHKKILSLVRWTEDHERSQESEFRDVYEEINQNREDLITRIEDFERSQESEFREVYKRIEDFEKNVEIIDTDFHRGVDERFKALNQYVDSRFDKHSEAIRMKVELALDATSSDLKTQFNNLSTFSDKTRDKVVELSNEVYAIKENKKN